MNHLLLLNRSTNQELREYEPDLEDIFLLIMDKLGARGRGHRS